MSNPDNQSHNFTEHMLAWGKICADVAEDVSQALMGFIPNGLNLTYNFVLKPLPVLGRFFSHRWVEQVFKLCSGVTIGQGLALDIAHFVFRPLGFALGTLMGAGPLANVKNMPRYQGQVGKLLYRLSAQTVSGALVGLLAIALIYQFFEMTWSAPIQIFVIAAGCGAVLGLMAKSMVLIALNTVTNANAATVRKNVQRAKDLNKKLKNAAKLKAKSRILMHAQDIIQQVNGPQLQHLEEFFAKKYEVIAVSTNKKIERHFNYLTDRACHGDAKALKRLQELVPSRLPPIEGGKNAFEVMLDRIFNKRAIFHLKDDVDTAYDRWQYRFLRTKISSGA